MGGAVIHPSTKLILNFGSLNLKRGDLVRYKSGATLEECAAGVGVVIQPARGNKAALVWWSKMQKSLFTPTPFLVKHEAR